ncbi:MAG: isoaspartyl peptidase/L-asparaginase [Deltaproteobacteria bacterium]|nr:isoaspartyl peptidase/L-asparaginase [Deltaproteobacteria bacterium]
MLLLAHGGAGTKKPSKAALKKLHESLKKGYGILEAGGTALQAVIGTIAMLEDSGLFNAGLGANLQLDGIRRLDAAVMEGSRLQAGSVIGLEGIQNPIKAASIVMESPHKILTNIGAKVLAAAYNLKPLPDIDEKYLERLKKMTAGEYELVRIFKKHFSTVGAVALDSNGDIAAGSSTGGVALMLPGRVGDTPIIGAGVYAENKTGAVSCTGRGEDIIRIALAKEVSMRMIEKTPLRAAREALKKILEIGGDAGLLALNRQGKFAIIHTTEKMPGGYAGKDGIIVKEGFTRVRPKNSHMR